MFKRVTLKRDHHFRKYWRDGINRQIWSHNIQYTQLWAIIIVVYYCNEPLFLTSAAAATHKTTKPPTNTIDNLAPVSHTNPYGSGRTWRCNHDRSQTALCVSANESWQCIGLHMISNTLRHTLCILMRIYSITFTTLNLRFIIQRINQSLIRSRQLHDLKRFRIIYIYIYIYIYISFQHFRLQLRERNTSGDAVNVAAAIRFWNR